MKDLKSFKTINACVDYLQMIGCNWTYDKECELKTKASYSFQGTVVIYDPYDLLN